MRFEALLFWLTGIMCAWVISRPFNVGLLKKETEIELETEAGKSYYIACNVKTSITRARLELIEVTKSTADKQMAKMSLDHCQDKIDGE